MVRARAHNETERFYGGTNRSHRPTNFGLIPGCFYGKFLSGSCSASCAFGPEKLSEEFQEQVNTQLTRCRNPAIRDPGICPFSHLSAPS